MTVVSRQAGSSGAPDADHQIQQWFHILDAARRVTAHGAVVGQPLARETLLVAKVSLLFFGQTPASDNGRFCCGNRASCEGDEHKCWWGRPGAGPHRQPGTGFNSNSPIRAISKLVTSYGERWVLLSGPLAVGIRPAGRRRAQQ